LPIIAHQYAMILWYLW